MYDLERPFHRLIHHFIVRIFRGAGDGDDLQFSIPAILGLLSVPSAFGAIELMSKYSTLRLFLLGRPQLNLYRATVPDEYFFVVYSFVITGAVVILKWDRLFPDRQDYDNLAVLPLSARQNFLASLSAVLLIAALFAATVNGAASVIFPLGVTASEHSFMMFVEFAVAHAVSVFAASLFACFSLLLVMGTTLLIAPRQYSRTVSLGVRIVCALGLIGTLGTVFPLSDLLSKGHVPPYAFYMPTVWFLDLQQMLLSRGQQLTGSGLFALEITGATFALAMVAYAVTYYREYMRIPERIGLVQGRGRDEYSWIRRLWDSFVLRGPFQRATFHFATKTLFRSEKHCLLLGTASAVGLFLAVQTAGEALGNPTHDRIDPRLLSVALTIAYILLVSLRALFDLPSDRNASWIFRFTLDLTNHEGRASASKVMMALVLPWLLLIALPLHVVLWGWTTALLHTAYVLMSSIVLAQVLLLRFRKIPFTCLYTASKDRVLLTIFLAFVGLYVFAGSNASMEASLLDNPVLFLFAVPVFCAICLVIRFYHEGLPSRDRTLIFEDRPAPAIQVLNLLK